MTKNRIDGSYKTTRDGGLLYSYQASWVEVTSGVDWQATVMRDKLTAGTPSGHIGEPVGPDIASVIKKLLNHYIERQIGVR